MKDRLVIITPSFGEDSGGPGKIAKFILQSKIIDDFDEVHVIRTFPSTTSFKHQASTPSARIVYYNPPSSRLLRAFYFLYLFYALCNRKAKILSIGDWLWTSLSYFFPYERRIFRFAGDAVWERSLLKQRSAISTPDFKMFYAANWKRRIIFLIRSIILRKFSALICGSFEAQKTLDFWTGGKSRIVVVRNPIMVNGAGIARNYRHRSVVLASRLIPIKNIPRSIKILNELNIKPYIYGSGPLSSELAQSTYGSANFEGFLQHDELLKKLTDFRFFLTLSASEQSPNSIIDAMSQGVVPIASDIPPHREILQNISTELLVNISQDDQGCVKTLKNILHMPEDNWQMLSALCVKYVANLHDSRIFEARVANVLHGKKNEA